MTTTISNQKSEPTQGLLPKETPSKLKTFGFAIAIILGYTAFVIAGIVYSQPLNRLNITLLATSLVTGILFLTLGLIGAKNHLGSSPSKGETSSPTVIAPIYEEGTYEQIGKICGPAAWKDWDVEVCDQAPLPPKINWKEKDAKYPDKCLEETSMLVYVPSNIIFEGKQQKFSTKTHENYRIGSFPQLSTFLNIINELRDAKDYNSGWQLINMEGHSRD